MGNWKLADFKGDVDTILASATKQSRREIKRIMKQSGEIALSFDNAIYLAVGLEPATIAQNPALQAVLLQLLSLLNHPKKPLCAPHYAYEALDLRILHKSANDFLLHTSLLWFNRDNNCKRKTAMPGYSDSIRNDTYCQYK